MCVCVYKTFQIKVDMGDEFVGSKVCSYYSTFAWLLVYIYLLIFFVSYSDKDRGKL